MLGPALIALVGSLAAASPLASPSEESAVAARPLVWSDLPAFDARRLRLSAGATLQQLELRAPDALAAGPSFGAALELEGWEAAAALRLLGGIPAGDDRARHTGLSAAQLELAARLSPLSGRLRVMVEAAAMLGYERSWAWCSEGQCGLSPGHPTFGAALGALLQLRVGRRSALLGFSLFARGPAAPSPLRGAAPLGALVRLELGIGGRP